MFFVLSNQLCDDYVLATFLVIIRRVIDLIQLLAPIILLIAALIQFIKMVINPDDDKKGKKKILNSFLSAIIIFFIPLIINLTMKIIAEYGDVGINNEGEVTAFNLSACWNSVNETQDVMDSANENKDSDSPSISNEVEDEKKKFGSTQSSSK